MKTITLKFIVEDDDSDVADQIIEEALQNDANLGSLPMFCYDMDKANEDEIEWHKKYIKRD